LFDRSLATLALCSWASGQSSALAADPLPKTAAETKPAAVLDVDGKVDPAKKAAIKELLVLTKLSESYGAIRDIMLAQVRRSVNSLLQKLIADDASVSSAQKKQMLDTVSDSSDRIINRYRTLSAERIDMPAIMEQVAYKVYDESFTTSEIQDLIAFYRTPTGQKALKEMPEIMHRSMTLSAQLLQSKVIDIVKEVSSEEMARLKNEASSASKPGGAAPPAAASSSSASSSSSSSSSSTAGSTTYTTTAPTGSTGTATTSTSINGNGAPPANNTAPATSGTAQSAASDK
jgi:hypothetical protein